MTALVLAAVLAAAAPTDETVHFGSFGTVHLYRRSPHPSRVALFVSGDGGWNQGVVSMAQSLADDDALVAGVDIRPYLKALDAAKGACSFPAGDFEALGQFLEKKLEFPALSGTLQRIYTARIGYLTSANQFLAGKVALEQAIGGPTPL